MLNATRMLVKPIEKSTSSANAEFTMNKLATKHGAQPRLKNKLYATIRLRIPRKPRCGGKPVKGNEARMMSPVIP